MSHLKTPQTQLTIIFTIIILVLFLTIGSVFFVFKYIGNMTKIENEFTRVKNIIGIQKKEIVNFVHKKWKKTSLGTQDFEAEEIEKVLLFTHTLFDNPDAKFWYVDKTKNVEEVLVEWRWDFPFFNHKIVIFEVSQNDTTWESIIYSNIEDNLKIDFKKYLENNEKNNEIIFEQKLAILQTHIWINKSLVFIEREYSSDELMWDIIYLVLSVFWFSIFFYFIGWIFVRKVLKPVEENIEEMNHFIDNAGHELKTPLAAIQSSSSLMKELKNFEPELIQEIIDETKKSNEIISALRSLTKISKNTQTEIFTIQAIIKNVFISFKIPAQENNITLKFVNIDDLEVTAHKNYFYIMVSNIISNAIKYNKKWWTVTAEIWERFLIISDSGIGIPMAEQKSVFQRFKRLKNHSDIEGFGLWLSMVEKICKIYHWNITVESIEGIGTKIKIVF